MNDVSERPKMHLNEYRLTKSEFCKSCIHLVQPPISWKICDFSSLCNTGVRVNGTARLYILCKYVCFVFCFVLIVV